MGAYWIALRRAPRALRLFLVFTFLANAGLGVYQLLYPLYLVRLGYRDDVVGAVSAATMVAVAAGALALGPLLRRHGAWRCLCVGAALLAVAAAGQALARPLPLLLAAAALAGLGQAGILVPTMPFLLPHTTEEGRTETVAATYALLSAALMLGALVGGHLPALLGVGAAPDAAAPYRATLLVGVALLAAGLPPLLRIGRPAPGAPAPAPARAAASPPARDGWGPVAAFVAVGVCFSLSGAAFDPFAAVYLQALGADPGTTGTVFALGGGVGALLSLAAPRLARRHGFLPTSASLRLTALPLVLALLALPLLPLACAAVGVRAVALAMAWPVDSTFIAAVVPPGRHAAVYSLRSAAFNGAWAAGSVLAGWAIVAAGGYHVAFAANGAFLLLGLAVYIGAFARDQRGRPRRAVAVTAEEQPAAPAAEQAT